MMYRERARPDNEGEGEPIHTTTEAQRICEKHNLLYRRYKHWYERTEINPEENGHQAAGDQ